MPTIINGTTDAITFPDSTIQNTSAVVSGKVPYSVLPTGSVLQVVNATYATQASTTSTSFVDTGLTATITPKFSTSKILVIATAITYTTRPANGTGSSIRIVRASTPIYSQTDSCHYISVVGGTNVEIITNDVVQYLDSPATTSATAYKIQFKVDASSTAYYSWNNNTSVITLMEIAG